MCGITGFIDLNSRSSGNILAAMTATLSHRGPDGEGIVFKEGLNYQVGLGHRRLAVIDLSPAGEQPMNYEHLTITYNGEIYNYLEIKDDLIQLQHVFRGNSDTEVILHAFAEWGPKCLDKFTGMFAFVIYDQNKQELFFARDRAGVKPLSYYWKDGLFLFGSELKALHEHPQFSKKINLPAALAFVQFGNVPAPHCIFEDCYKLEPGHYLKFEINTRTFKIHQYWNVYDFYNKPKLDISFEEAKEQTERLLVRAANLRMVSDVPVGVFLSGGYDSSCLTALLQKNRSEKIKTFTIGVGDGNLNEAPFASRIAKHLGTEHTEYYCTEKDALDILPQLATYFDEPFGDHSAIPTMLVSKIARREVTVALSADGGDECFAGYNRYRYLMREGKFLQKIPVGVRRAISSVMKTVPPAKIPYLKNKPQFSTRYTKLHSLLDNPSFNNIMLRLTKQYSEEEIKSVFLRSVSEPATAYTSDHLLEKFFTPLSYIMAIDYQTYLPDDILQKVDRASMSQSLEAREPWLDHHIIEYAAQLPDNFKYYNHQTKYILKEITHSYIPKNIMERPKMGFAIPINNWLYSELRPQVQHYLNKNRLREQNIFDPDYVDNIIKEFYSGKMELGLKLWYFFVFQLWYEKWIK